MLERVTCLEDISQLKNNSIIGVPQEWGKSFVVEFSGSGNILMVEEGTRLGGGKVRFPGSNGIVVLRGSKHPYLLDVTVWSESLFFCDTGSYFNGQLHAIASEGRYIVLGRDCLFSFGIWLRTADPHLVYDVQTHKRINSSKDILIGDHVWIGQDAMILKGSTIGSGSIIGAKSLVAGKAIPSNSSWGGNPAKEIRGDIFWDGASTHNWGPEQTKRSQNYHGDNYIFKADDTTVDRLGLMQEIHDVDIPQERLKLIRAKLTRSDKNRFYILGKKKRGFLSIFFMTTGAPFGF